MTTNVVTPLIVEQDGDLAVLKLNRPERLNALSPDLLSELNEHVPRLVASPEVRAIMITGVGRAFCAGGDVGGMGGSSFEQIVAGMSATHGWFHALRCAEKLVISAVNGVAAGGGFGLALFADLVVASDAAYFKAAFTDLGLAADFGLAFTLPRAVGQARAAEIIYSDRKVSAVEALELGLIARVFPAATFEADARAFGRSMAATPRGAQLTKRLMRLDEAEAFSTFLAREARTQAEAFMTEDFREGVTAFREKRRAAFKGR